jgi:translation initiation factor IF-2
MLAGQHGVPIIKSDIIYRLMEEVKAQVVKLLPVIIESKVIGEAKVLQLFDIQLKGKVTKQVAGSRVINGLVEKNKLARVVRDGEVVHNGTLCDCKCCILTHMFAQERLTQCGISKRM